MFEIVGEVDRGHPTPAEFPVDGVELGHGLLQSLELVDHVPPRCRAQLSFNTPALGRQVENKTRCRHAAYQLHARVRLHRQGTSLNPHVRSSEGGFECGRNKLGLCRVALPWAPPRPSFAN